MSKVLKNALPQWLYTFFAIVFAFIVTPLLLARFGKEQYGIWMISGVIVRYLSLVDLGIGNSVARFTARFHALGDNDSLSRLFSTSFFIMLALAVLVALLTLAVSPLAPGFMEIKEEYHHTLTVILMIMGFSVALSFPLRVGVGVLYGYHYYDKVSWTLIACMAAQLAVIILVFGRGHGSLYDLAWISFIFSMLPFLIIMFLAKLHSPMMKIHPRLFSKPMLKSVFSLSASALVISFCALLYKQTQVVIAGKMLGDTAIVIIGITLNLMNYLNSFFASISRQFVPFSSAMDSTGNQEVIGEAAVSGVRFLFGAVFFIFVLTVAWGDDFFRLWLLKETNDLTPENIHTIYLCMVISVGALTISIPQVISHSILISVGKHFYVAITFLFSSLLGIALSITLILKFNMDVTAIAWGWASTLLVNNIIFIPAGLLNYLKRAPVKYFMDVYLAPLLTVGIIAAPVLFVSTRMAASNYFYLFGYCALCSILFAVPAYFFVLDDNLRSKVAGIIGRWKKT